VVHPIMGPEGRVAGDRSRHAAKRVEQTHQRRKVAPFELDDTRIQDQPRPKITLYVAIEGAYMAAQDRRFLENGDFVRPVQQMSGHEPGTAATDDCNLQAVFLQFLAASGSEVTMALQLRVNDQPKLWGTGCTSTNQVLPTSYNAHGENPPFRDRQ